MRREDLERYLERGDTLGFRTQTDSAETLGWILLDKQKPNERYLAALRPGERSPLIDGELRKRHRPYHLFVAELPREAHERGDYLENEDYRLRENHYFATLDEVEQFVARRGLTLAEIKWLIDIDAP